MQKTKLALDTLSKLPGNLGELAFSFSRHLEAEGRATETIYTYLTAVRLLGEHLSQHDRPLLAVTAGLLIVRLALVSRPYNIATLTLCCIIVVTFTFFTATKWADCELTNRTRVANSGEAIACI